MSFTSHLRGITSHLRGIGKPAGGSWVTPTELDSLDERYESVRREAADFRNRAVQAEAALKKAERNADADYWYEKYVRQRQHSEALEQALTRKAATIKSQESALKKAERAQETADALSDTVNAMGGELARLRFDREAARNAPPSTAKTIDGGDVDFWFDQATTRMRDLFILRKNIRKALGYEEPFDESR